LETKSYKKCPIDDLHDTSDKECDSRFVDNRLSYRTLVLLMGLPSLAAEKMETAALY